MSVQGCTNSQWRSYWQDVGDRFCDTFMMFFWGLQFTVLGLCTHCSFWFYQCSLEKREQSRNLWMMLSIRIPSYYQNPEDHPKNPKSRHLGRVPFVVVVFFSWKSLLALVASFGSPDCYWPLSSLDDGWPREMSTKSSIKGFHETISVQQEPEIQIADAFTKTCALDCVGTYWIKRGFPSEINGSR